MKKTFAVKDWVFGAGMPKICVPIVETTREAIWEKAEEIAELPVQIVEWRVDFYEDVFCTDKMLDTLQGLRERLKEKALLFTFRTKGEGGNLPVEKDRYYELNQTAAASGYADLVDLEAFLDEEQTPVRIRKLKEAGSRVITSNHDFQKTPPVEEMERRLRQMAEMGADVAKLAVMPAGRQDVMDLLQATVSADEELQIPVVTMSMGRQGVLSRIAGELTGSAMTFAALGSTSAPGQIPVKEMVEILSALG